LVGCWPASHRLLRASGLPPPIGKTVGARPSRSTGATCFASLPASFPKKRTSAWAGNIDQSQSAMCELRHTLSLPGDGGSGSSSTGMAMAHTLGDKVEAPYRRGDGFQKRLARNRRCSAVRPSRNWRMPRQSYLCVVSVKGRLIRRRRRASCLRLPVTAGSAGGKRRRLEGRPIRFSAADWLLNLNRAFFVDRRGSPSF